jgi:hypothetical protein
MSDRTDLAEAIQSLRRVMATDPRDWGECRRDSWAFGVVLGWGEEALAEQAERHGWPAEDLPRIERYAAAIEAAAGGTQNG